MKVVSSIIGVLLIVAVAGLVFWQKSANETSVQEPSGSDTDMVSDVINSAPRGATDDEREDEDEVTNQPSGNTGAGTSAGTSGGAQGSGISVATVAQHNTRASCWSSINGNVYDLTSLIPKHPGGEQAILQLCGTDGSAKFNGKHGGDAAKEKNLAGFKVGVLAN